jgi:hypothetical protein
MTSDLSELSKALVLYLGYGIDVAPVCKGARVIELYGQETGAALLRDACTLMDETARISIDGPIPRLMAQAKSFMPRCADDIRSLVVRHLMR